ncbi:MAG TPA: hypothetical protein VK966_01060 [Longimicrobiales bacterium]|nr:hypothetical protein [Longimicrobiales bacterium]
MSPESAERLISGALAVLCAAIALRLLHGRLPRSRRLDVVERVRGVGW